jgi:hypothetical protein
LPSLEGFQENLKQESGRRGTRDTPARRVKAIGNPRAFRAISEAFFPRLT